MTPRGLVIRLAAWGCAFAILLLIARHERGILFDERVVSANTCGVDSIVTYPQSREIVDLQFGEEAVAQLSLFGTSVTAANLAEPFETATLWRESVPRSARPTLFEYRLATANAPIVTAVYTARVFPAFRTVHVTLVPHSRAGVAIRGAGIAATVNGFDVQAPDGRVLSGGQGTVATPRRWVVLRNGRCNLLVWGRGLKSVTAAWRPGFPLWADFLFHVSPTARNRVALNFTFAYGDVSRGVAFVNRNLAGARSE